MTLIQDILENEKYIELMKMKKENEGLKSNFNNDNSRYGKLMRKGLSSLTTKRILTDIPDKEWRGYKIGLNKFGVGRYSNWISWEKKEIKGNISHIDDLSDLKKFDWKELRSKLNLDSNAMERYNIVMRSIENYDVDGLVVKKEINKTIINNNGDNVFIKELRMDDGFYMKGNNFDSSDWRLSKGLGNEIHDFLILEQLYDDLRDMAYEFRDLAIKTMKHNIIISDKLKDDLSYYFVADII